MLYLLEGLKAKGIQELMNKETDRTLSQFGPSMTELKFPVSTKQ